MLVIFPGIFLAFGGPSSVLFFGFGVVCGLGEGL
jgi:hypothetical protein